MRQYRVWQQHNNAQTDGVALLYGRLQGVMLRRYAVDALKLYRIVKRDFNCAYQDYFRQNERIKII